MSQQQPRTGNGQGEELTVEDIIGGYRKRRDSDTDYLQEVAAETEVGEKYKEEFAPEFSREAVLSNRNEAEVWEAYWTLHMRTNDYLSEFPPQGSKMTGLKRELVYGNRKEPLSNKEVRDVLAVEEQLKARILQGRDMEQQKLIKEIRSENTVHRNETGKSRIQQFRDQYLGGGL
jgi:hypothetical protein